MTLDEQIATAQRHVDSGRLIVKRQQAIVARYGWSSAIDLLESFERTQQIFEADLAKLLNSQMDTAERAPYPHQPKSVDLPACPVMAPAEEIYLVRVTTDNREHRLWAASIMAGEEAVRAVLDAVPEGWAVSLLARANPDEVGALALKLGEVRELPNA